MPTRSPHRPNLRLSRSARHLPRWRLAWALALGLCATLGSHAHETTHSGLPEAPGVRVDASAALAHWDADSSVPAPRFGGTLGLGDTPNDLRGGHLEHATLGLGVRLLPQLGANVTMGWHGSDQRHVETAWLHAQPSADSPLSLGAGRNRVPIGPVLRNAGHLDRYGQMPLAKRATFNGDWIDDGINATWRPQLGGALAWLDVVDVGLWKAQRFPGSTGSDWAPVLHLGARWGQASVDAFYSHLRPQGRGAYVQSTTSGHVHTAPACEASLRGITCFDGQVDLLGGSATWHTPLRGVQLSAAALWRRERGALYSNSGDTRYRGDTQGGWLELLWQPAAQWELGVRQEWLRQRNDVNGPGAYAVATEANLLPNEPARRTSAMVGWRPARDWLLAVEAGHERIAGQGNTVLGLRLMWTPTQALWQRNW